MKETTLADVASAIIPIEDAPRQDGKPTCAFASLLAHPDRNPFLNWNPIPLSIRHYRIPNVVLEARFRGLFVGDAYVRDTRYLTPEAVVRDFRVRPREEISTPTLAGTAIIGSNGPSHNYFHWMTQALPALDIAVRREGQSRRVSLVLPILTPWQEDALRLLGHADLPRVTVERTERQYFFPEVEYSNILTGSSAFSRSNLVRETFRRLRDAVETTGPRNKALFVARTDGGNRPMRNEAALIVGMKARGFEIIEPGRMTLAEQIATFKHASIVVGPHGAGLSNVIFCTPGTMLYEILPAAYDNACFCNLALAADLQYWADAFESEGHPNVDPYLRDWESDTTQVLARVDEIMAHLDRQRTDERSAPISAMDFLRGKDGIPTDHAVSVAEADEAVGGFRQLLRRLFGLG